MAKTSRCQNFNQFLRWKMLVPSKSYKSTKVDRRTWLHVSSGGGLTGPAVVTLTRYLKYKKRQLLRCIHHFKSHLINNIDDMHFSGEILFVFS